MLLLRKTTLSLLLMLYSVSGTANLRGNEDVVERRRNQEETTNSNSGLEALRHFGLNPLDFAAGGSSKSTTTISSAALPFEPCDDVKTCLQLSVILAEIDDTILQGNVECTDVEDCATLERPGAECRFVEGDLKCDVEGKLYCGFPCVEDDTSGNGNIIP